MYFQPMVWITILSFVVTLIFILWRPKGVNEAIPATIGAIVVLLSGSVSLSDLGLITETINGAAITIIATIVMAMGYTIFTEKYVSPSVRIKTKRSKAVINE